MLETLPIVSIAGWSGSGKTSLIESILPSIHQMGLRAAVLKHASEPIESALLDLIRYNDLLLVEGGEQTPLPKFWLLQTGTETVPSDIAGPVIQALPLEANRKEIVLNFIKDWLPKQWSRIPVYGGVLIGGKSRRMGQPKHFISDGERTWLETIMNVVRSKTDRQVIVGEGELPDGLRGTIQLPDVCGAHGPMAGILSAMRWEPYASWIVCACDMPNMQPDALDWLLEQRKPGCWLVAPQMPNAPAPEPMLALYDFRFAPVLEQRALERRYKLNDLADHPKAAVIPIPTALQPSWENINTPDDLGPV